MDVFRGARRNRLFLVLSATAVGLTLIGSAAADQAYTDPAGDGKVGTDVVNLTVKNDASGNLVIDVTSVNPVVANHAIAIFVNADRNTATGSPTGDEYWFYGGPDIGRGFFAWNGSQFAPASPASFTAGRIGSNTSQFRINKADLANTSSFSFVVISISLDNGNVNFWDFAPDSGTYLYTLATPAPTPTTTTTPRPAPVTVSLARPIVRAPGLHAGKQFVVASRVRTNGRGLRVRCQAKVAGRGVPVTGQYIGGYALCFGRAPVRSGGKRLVGSVTVVVRGGSVAKTFSFVIEA